MKIILPALALTSLCSTLSHVQAQDNVEQVLVTANRFAQSAETINASTTIITREEIANSMARDLPDLLSGKAGLHFAQSGGKGGQSSLFLRGTESDHTLVLIDGVQVTTATGSSARLEYISLDQIERIEVVRGPRSSIYGSEAIGGVLQIFTQNPAGSDAENFDVALNIGGGTENSFNYGLDISGVSESNSWSLNYSKNETDGIDSKVSGNNDDDGYSNDSLSASITQKITDAGELFFNYSLFDAESDYDDGRVESRNEQISGGLRIQFSDIWKSTISIESFDEENDNFGAFGETFSRTETRTLRVHNDVSWSENSHLAIGVDSKQQELDYRTFGAEQSNDSRDNDGTYITYWFNPGPVDFTVAVREDDNELFGSQTTGSLSLGSNLNATTRLYLSYGTAFKAPNLIDLYVDFPSFFFFANPDLQPETSRNIEVGLSTTVLETNLKLNLFRNDIDDLIATDASFTSLANVENAQIDGMELLLERQLGQWGLDLALTILDHENQSTSEALLRRPETTLSLGASRQFDDFTLGLNWLAQSDHFDIDPNTFSRSEVGGYGVLNLIGGYQLSDEITLRFRIGNVFDKDYQIIDGFNTYGRTASVTANWRF